MDHRPLIVSRRSDVRGLFRGTSLSDESLKVQRFVGVENTLLIHLESSNGGGGNFVSVAARQIV